MTHQDVYDLAPEYVLGTLDEVTRVRVMAHLSACPACRAEVAGVSQTLDAVGRSVPEAEPPARLRERIREIPLLDVQSPRASSMPAPVLTWARFDTVFRLAAAAVLAVALWQWSAAVREADVLTQQLADMRADAGAIQVLRASDMVAYQLSAQTPAPGAHARAYVSHKDGMVFIAEGLPAVPTGKVYQLWVIVNATPISAGVFTPDATGRVHAVMNTPSMPAMPGTVAVTLEPTGGLPQPTGAVYLAGTAPS